MYSDFGALVQEAHRKGDVQVCRSEVAYDEVANQKLEKAHMSSKKKNRTMWFGLEHNARKLMGHG